jgi:hypothetical protein
MDVNKCSTLSSPLVMNHESVGRRLGPGGVHPSTTLAQRSTSPEVAVTYETSLGRRPATSNVAALTLCRSSCQEWF